MNIPRIHDVPFHPVAHFKTITHHKKLVMKYCFRLGLYRQGLLHDLSKYGPREFLPGCRYYQGDRSPNNAEREDTGLSVAWLHHKGRNKHHYEYWIDYSADLPPHLCGMYMPVRYVVEMFCDRVAASRTYKGDAYKDSDPLAYYQLGFHKKSEMLAMIHPESEKLLRRLLVKLAEEGEDAAFAYIREKILPNAKKMDRQVRKKWKDSHPTTERTVL